MATLTAEKNNMDKKNKNTTKVNTPEIGSALVRIAHKISSVNSQSQVVKIGDRYFRVRELG